MEDEGDDYLPSQVSHKKRTREEQDAEDKVRIVSVHDVVRVESTIVFFCVPSSDVEGGEDTPMLLREKKDREDLCCTSSLVSMPIPTHTYTNTHTYIYICIFHIHTRTYIQIRTH